MLNLYLVQYYKYTSVMGQDHLLLLFWMWKKTEHYDTLTRPFYPHSNIKWKSGLACMPEMCVDMSLRSDMSLGSDFVDRGIVTVHSNAHMI